MDDSERRSAGMKVRRRVLGDAHVDRATAHSSPVTADFQDLITRYAWGEIWTRPGLDERSRRILVLGTLVALGRFDEFRMHARAAIDHGGFTPDDLKEIVLQQAIYCGVPAANSAFEIVREVAGGNTESTR
jgi:4-carboxymuconolactone decarboxylase